MPSSAVCFCDFVRSYSGRANSVFPWRCGVAKSQILTIVDGVCRELRRWREAEVTHGRVAMLAALGFIVQVSLQHSF